LKLPSLKNAGGFESATSKATQKNLAHQEMYYWAGNQFTGGLIADIGSELGFGLHLLNRGDRKIIGLDINFDALFFSKTRINKQQNFIHLCGDSGKIPLADNCCSGICLVNVLHLVLSPLDVLKTYYEGFLQTVFSTVDQQG
jgi:SAM-dependent methyltransferase